MFWYGSALNTSRYYPTLQFEEIDNGHTGGKMTMELNSSPSSNMYAPNPVYAASLSELWSLWRNED